MPYDFFNTSNLAFGKRLTSTFISLNNLADSAEENLQQIFADQAIFEQYINRNYLVPMPNRADAACRADEIFDLIDEKNIIKTLEYKSGKLNVEINYFNADTDRMTIAYGSTSIKEGSCYLMQAISNGDPLKELQFYNSDYKGYPQGIHLFDYRIDGRNNINITGATNNLNIKPFDFSQYKSMSKGSNISLPYTAKDYECICVVGKTNNIDIALNGTRICYGKGDHMVRHTILYLKPNDKVTGTYSSAFKVYYNK